MSDSGGWYYGECDIVVLDTVSAHDAQRTGKPEQRPSASEWADVRRGLRERLLAELAPEDRARVLEATPYTAATDPIWITGFAAMSAVQRCTDGAVNRIDQARESIDTAAERIRTAESDFDEYHERVLEESIEAYRALTRDLKEEIQGDQARDRKAGRAAMRKGITDAMALRWPIYCLGMLTGMSLIVLIDVIATVTRM